MAETGGYYYGDGGADQDYNYGDTSESNTSNYNDSNAYDGYDFYRYDEEYYGNNLNEFHYRAFDFERPIYLYAWVCLIIVTTLANILVMLVLRRRSMRNATNTVLIAIAGSDSLTGLVTLPVVIHAYQQYSEGALILSEEWCEALMIVKYFVSRGFHTMSIWLTVALGFQRLISVCFPFRAQAMFSIRNTVWIIIIVSVLSPVLHIYHVFNRKSFKDEVGNGYCAWVAETPCRESCVYLWLTIILMHFLPCILLVVCTLVMIVMMYETTKKMRNSHMIANQANLHRRNMESKRISCIVIAVVIVFLIPEIPYGIFLMITVILKHSGKRLLDLKTNRAVFCAYDILLVLSFHANFWIYLIMNRRFRRGLQRLFDPVEALVYAVLAKFGIEQGPRRRSDSTSIGRAHSDVQSVQSHTAHYCLSHSNSINSAPLELRTYNFKTDGSSNGILPNKDQDGNALLQTNPT